MRALNPSALFSLAIVALVAGLAYHGISEMDYRWRWGRIGRYFITADGDGWRFGELTLGLFTTLKLSLLAGVATLAVGMLAAAARLSARPALRGLAVGYIQLMRCTPLLVQLYLLYFMFSSVLGLQAFYAGVIALTLFEAAFAAEIFRAAVLSVPQGQVEAAAGLGLSRLRVWQKVIIPQALPLLLPALANLLVSLIKHSSIVTIVAIADLTDVARNLVAKNFLAFEIWFAVGLMYVAICLPLAWLIRRWETRLNAVGARL